MMENLPLAEYGVAIFAVGALVYVVLRFIKAMEKKDTSFTDVINNHLTEDKKIRENLIASNSALAKSHERLEEAIGKLLDRL